MFQIMTVCTGNICRSPMAEYMLRHALQEAGVEQVAVISRAVTDGEIGNRIDPRAAALLTVAGIDASAHRATGLRAEELAGMDLVLAMDIDHFEILVPYLAELDPEQRPQLRMVRSFDPEAAAQPHQEQGIYDPWYGDAADFQQTYSMIEQALPALVNYVRSNISSRGNR
ncbi:low molecular weight protein-tyrosine-phosphatase [Glutamicibacter endophyticus]|uniref:low molecular weight protein-tyrosine-phosphatase n=1 Tax=Glutamicibacter sp. PS TaxID=3075634 RepID=UPI002841FCCA|nr:low molecular weight protein-tyrosine-phosphatase [Glutamicibacter sp. PS]MDR4532023.1 low molecular weight phosphotyrosine protein phosphatase [Glutamicibacter sp. PS]